MKLEKELFDCINCLHLQVVGEKVENGATNKQWEGRGDLPQIGIPLAKWNTNTNPVKFAVELLATVRTSNSRPYKPAVRM